MNEKDTIQLIKPTLALKDKALAYRQEHFDAKEKIINGSELFDQIPEYEQWLQKVKANACKETVLPGWVYTDTFFALRESDQRIIGMIDLRYELNAFLKDLGNCGYSVRPSERRKGYATQILKEVCKKAKAYGLPRLQLSVEKDNLASIRTIEKNGGCYQYSFPYENEEADVYYIDLYSFKE